MAAAVIPARRGARMQVLEALRRGVADMTTLRTRISTHPTASFFLLALGVGAYTLAVRPRPLRWGATDAEVAAAFPGADLVPGGRRGATMAVTIDAPPAAVWPWLAQMGCDRAGWYSWDRLDNGGVQSATRIHPEWQQVAVGDHWISVPSGATWFEVAAVEPERFLALRAPLDLHGGRPFDPARRRPCFYNDTLWAFLLNERQFANLKRRAEQGTKAAGAPHAAAA